MHGEFAVDFTLCLGESDVPFTPIHMGPGMLVKPVLQERFSLMMFGWSQIMMDIQPLENSGK